MRLSWTPNIGTVVFVNDYPMSLMRPVFAVLAIHIEAMGLSEPPVVKATKHPLAEIATIKVIVIGHFADPSTEF